MALEFAAPFPIFSAKAAPSTEIRFSLWNNANAGPVICSHRRDCSALRIDKDADDDAAVESSPPPAADFRSGRTPSFPSAPYISSRASKYPKSPLDPKDPRSPSHPAFRRIAKARIPAEPHEESGISVGKNGISYRIKGAPFEFQYSYTETPKVKPLALREPPFLPFGPTTMPRPWTGRAPLPPSKKKLPEFDSFKLPPPGKKGVKSIQAPGPFLAGSGPKYRAASREEILGDPLTAEEIKDLIKGSLKARRQLNMGRDGLTHNMLDNIHAHWKRRRVCKIKCKGVCTVDMDNVREQLEEKTGGKIIYNKGGVIYLFRGRNYNYRTRPKYPLMLWKPVTPVYPRLVERVPEGLTLEEATEMRKKGRELPPICKLGKNGVYCNLVKQVREAFEACELVRINCKDMNKSDCRKIGAKLRDLVPCVLLSFECEHILMWRGKDWKSSLPPVEDNIIEAAELVTTDPTAASPSTNTSLLIDQDIRDLGAGMSPNKESNISISAKDAALDEPNNLLLNDQDKVDLGAGMSPMKESSFRPSTKDDAMDAKPRVSESECLSKLEISHLSRETTSDPNNIIDNTSALSTTPSSGDECRSEELFQDENKQISCQGEEAEHTAVLHVDPARHNVDDGSTRIDDSAGESAGLEMEERECLPNQNIVRSQSCLEGVMLLLREAVDSGAAVILDDAPLDANTVYERSVALAQTAPPGPTFRLRIKKSASETKTTEQQKSDKDAKQAMEVEVVSKSNKRISGKKSSRSRRRDNIQDILPDVVPHGSLGVDELAKLLA